MEEYRVILEIVQSISLLLGTASFTFAHINGRKGDELDLKFNHRKAARHHRNAAFWWYATSVLFALASVSGLGTVFILAQ